MIMSKKESIEKTRIEVTSAESQELANRLASEMTQSYGAREEAYISILIRQDDDGIIGGLNGLIHWRWLYIRHLWVEQNYRRQGYAKKLISAAKELAYKRNYIGVYIDTFDTNTAHFYENVGFKIYGEIPNFPAGFNRIFLYLPLSAHNNAP